MVGQSKLHHTETPTKDPRLQCNSHQHFEVFAKNLTPMFTPMSAFCIRNCFVEITYNQGTAVVLLGCAISTIRHISCIVSTKPHFDLISLEHISEWKFVGEPLEQMILNFYPLGGCGGNCTVLV